MLIQWLITVRYMTALRLYIPYRGTQENVFFNRVKKEIKDICTGNKSVTYQKIIELIGSPKEIAKDYLSESNDVERCLRLGMRIKAYKVTSLLIAIFAVVLLLDTVGTNEKKNENNKDTFNFELYDEDGNLLMKDDFSNEEDTDENHQGFVTQLYDEDGNMLSYNYGE